MDNLLQDLRFGWRTLWRSPGFAAVAIVTLALGIGANTAMFTVVNSVLLQRLPFKNPDSVLVVRQKMSNGGIDIFSTSDFLDWKEQGGVGAEMAATTTTSFNLSTDENSPERISGQRVSYNLFAVLGVQPALGRVFNAAEDGPGAAPVVLLSHALWKARFAANGDILGKLIVLDGVRYTVIGVMPKGFHIYADNELLWAPLQLQTSDAAASSSTVHWLGAITRMSPNESLAQAQAQLDAIATRLHREDPNRDAGFGIALQPIREAIVGNVRPALLILTACVGCVLLIACSNVANLLLARGTARRREISIRAALGASRRRVVRQLITESLLLSMLGGLLALAFAFIAVKALLVIGPASLPNLEAMAMDLRVLGYTLLTCVLVGTLFGTAPAFVSSNVDITESLKEGAGASSGAFGKHRAALVIAETALASMLLIGAGLLLKGVWLLRSVDPGFNAESLLTFRLAPPARVLGDEIPIFYEHVLEKIKTLPGVQSAALSRDLPMSGTDPSMPITIEGGVTSLAPGQIVTRFRAVGPQYFRTLQTPVLDGREFSNRDTRTSLPVAIVSESLARLYWPNENAIGKRLQPRFPDAPWYTVVGVVGDVRHCGLDVVIEPTAYYNYAQIPASVMSMVESYMTFAVRSSGASSGLLSAVRTAVSATDKTVPIYDVKKMDSMLSNASSLRRFDVALLGAFAGLALALAGIGVYGVMGYSVSQRTREIGIRMALGARRGDVLRLLVGQGAKLAVAGVVLGIISAASLGRVMSSLLYGVSPTDLLTFGVVAPIMLISVLLACYIPAARAAKIDPILALHCE